MRALSILLLVCLAVYCQTQAIAIASPKPKVKVSSKNSPKINVVKRQKVWTCQPAGGVSFRFKQMKPTKGGQNAPGWCIKETKNSRRLQAEVAVPRAKVGVKAG